MAASAARRRRRLIWVAVVAVLCLLFVGLGFVLAQSAFPQPVSAPNLARLDLPAARDAASAAGLRVVVDSPDVTTRLVPEGRVAEQVPSAGEAVLPGAVVHLRLSAGPPRVTVPDVRGLTPEQAQQVLAGLHLQTGAVTAGLAPDYQPGQVTASNPPAGTVVVEGYVVSLQRNRTTRELLDAAQGALH
jgi:serine/threonine-protein kinase